MTTYICPKPFHHIHWFFRFLTPHQKFVACSKHQAKHLTAQIVSTPNEVISDLFWGSDITTIYEKLHIGVDIHIIRTKMPHYIPDLRVYVKERYEAIAKEYNLPTPTKKQIKQYQKLKPLIQELKQTYNPANIINDCKNKNTERFNDLIKEKKRILRKAINLASKLAWSIYCTQWKRIYQISLQHTLKYEKEWREGGTDFKVRVRSDKQAKAIQKGQTAILVSNAEYFVREIYG